MKAHTGLAVLSTAFKQVETANPSESKLKANFRIPTFFKLNQAWETRAKPGLRFNPD